MVQLLPQVSVGYHWSYIPFRGYVIFFTDKAARIDWGNDKWWRLNRLGGSSKTDKGLWVVRCGYFKVGSHFTIKMVAIYIYTCTSRKRCVKETVAVLRWSKPVFFRRSYWRVPWWRLFEERKTPTLPRPKRMWPKTSADARSPGS